MDAGSPFRRPIPVARSILWAPPLGGGVRPAEIPFPMFLSQLALTAISEHVATPLRSRQGVRGFLLATDPAGPAGAFFRAGADEWVATRQPSYELLSDDSIRPGGKKRSFVTWKHYRAYTPVVPQPAPPRAATPPAPAPEPEPEPDAAPPRPPPPPRP